MKFLKALLLSVALASFSPLATADAGVVVHGAWIPEAPPVAQVMAAYMVVQNTSSKSITITGVSCDAFGMVMMHRTVTENGSAGIDAELSARRPARDVDAAQARVQAGRQGAHDTGTG